jgi:glycosyltransferase involved in cell wall biosynthesis
MGNSSICECRTAWQRHRPSPMKPKQSRPPSVIYVSTARNAPSAAAPYRDSFIHALRRNGLPTTVLTPTTKMIGTYPRRTKGYAGARGVPVSFWFLIDLVRSHARVVISDEYGIVTLLTLLVARILGRPALVFQEHVARNAVPLSAVDICYRRLIGRLASGFLANTTAARDEIVRVLRVDRAKVFQVMTLVPPDRHELCRVPLTIDPPSTRPLFLFMGQLIVRKNVEAILRASRFLKAQGLAFEVWIGGKGIDEVRLREIASHLRLDDVVRFIGPVPYASIGFVYEACDVFVMPSNADYRSVAVLEAMRFGKPVIDSAQDGNAHDCARDGFNALIFDPGDVRRLAECMRQFIDDPELASIMGARSEKIMDEHTPDSAALALIDVLTRLESARG